MVGYQMQLEVDARRDATGDDEYKPDPPPKYSISDQR
jgi:hypothetical protein